MDLTFGVFVGGGLHLKKLQIIYIYKFGKTDLHST
jgi:hypothetical protein